MATYVLVHGAWHGAWCWEPLERALRERGERTIAVELPCDDISAGCAAYARIVLDALAGVDADDAVLVGHSLAGLSIPLVAAQRPVRRLVFLCALIAQPGTSLRDQRHRDPEMFVPGFGQEIVADEQGRAVWRDQQAAIAAFYPDCPRQVAERAAARLRPQANLPSTEPCTLDALPPVRASYVLAREDRVVNPRWSTRAARERLGVQPIELPGGHSPFLARPAALADVLTATVQ
jgi:pimeloyl-ACP methyl ester carboxylesterase